MKRWAHSSSARPTSVRRVRHEPRSGTGRVSWQTRVLWGAGFVLLLAGLVWLVWPVFSMLVAATALAYILDPVVDRFEAAGRTRELGIGVVFALGSLLLTLLVLIFVPAVMGQVDQLVANAPGYVDRLQGLIGPWAAQIESTTGVHIPLDWGEVKVMAPELLEELSPDARKRMTGFVQGLFTSSFGFLLGLFNLALVPVFTFFLLRDWDRLVASVDALVPPTYRPRVRDIALQVDERLQGFVQGQITVALILAVLYSVGLWFSGIDLALTVGVLAGILFIVPYLGTFVGVGLATLLALVKFGFDEHLIYVALAFALPQLVESYLITPKIMGDKVGLHPMVIMVSLLVGGSLLGVWGMLIAIPLTAVGNVLLNEGLAEWRKSHVFAEST